MTSYEDWIRRWFTVIENEYVGLLERDSLNTAELGRLSVRLDTSCSGEFAGLPPDLNARRQALLASVAEATAKRVGVDVLWPNLQLPAGPVPDSPAALASDVGDDG